MAMTMCPDCKTQPVASGHYMCQACEARMGGGKTASSGQSTSPNDARCAKCATVLASWDLFCASCGTPRPRAASGRSSSARTHKEDRTYQDPKNVSGVYYCPKCNAVLEAGSRRCSACGVMFMHPVPRVGGASSSRGPAPNGGSLRPDLFCQDCDTHLNPDDDFCASCGAGQDRSNTGGAYPPPNRPTMAEDNVRRARQVWDGISNAHKAIGFGGLALLLIVIGVAGAHSGRPQASQETQNRPPPIPAVASPSSSSANAPQPNIPPPQPAPPPVLPAQIHATYDLYVPDIDRVIQGVYNTHLFGIANRDAFDWTNVEITINPGYGDFSARFPVVHPSTGQQTNGDPYMSTIIPYESFADPYGNRFQQTMKVNRIRITCDTPSGRATLEAPTE